jgi:hypothetical protein
VSHSGNLHALFHVTVNGAGHATLTSHVNPQGVSGIGQTTGVKYQGTGVTRSDTTARVGFQTTAVNNFRIIGQGPGNNFLVHDNLHFTINANGTITTFVDNLRIACK